MSAIKTSNVSTGVSLRLRIGKPKGKRVKESLTVNLKKARKQK